MPFEFGLAYVLERAVSPFSCDDRVVMFCSRCVLLRKNVFFFVFCQTKTVRHDVVPFSILELDEVT